MINITEVLQDDFFYGDEEKGRWSVKLSNGDYFVEKLENPGAWRNILEHAQKNNLSIANLRFDGKEIDGHSNTISYFVINDMLTLGALSNKQHVARMRKGFGSIRNNGKIRIRWVTVLGNEEVNNYTEVLLDENIYTEISLPIQRESTS
ncbi:MAG: hypothetical protein ACXADW_19110 [Candidatus Hodarchaeales archaeon]|jgi:hypothetical protein